jgi:hydroxymethylpyrimidine pyrophosphatase-like HAD family hydrolase
MRVAVANAVESLKAEADRVMRRPCGEGVVELVREHLLASP